MVDNPYAVLGIREDANPAVIDAAYETLAEQHSPEHGGDPDKFDRIHEAYKQISIADDPAETPDAITVSDDHAEIALTGIYKNADITDISEAEEQQRTMVSLWQIKNTGDYHMEWNYTDEDIIADDGFQYNLDENSLIAPRHLPPRWTIERKVSLKPGAQVYAIAAIEQMEETTPSEITIAFRLRDDSGSISINRYTFDIPNDFVRDLGTTAQKLEHLL